MDDLSFTVPKAVAQRAATPSNVAAISTARTVRACLRCGKPGPFRSKRAKVCLTCSNQTHSVVYRRTYQIARTLATRELAKRHPDEYRALMDECWPEARRRTEVRQVAREEAARRGAASG